MNENIKYLEKTKTDNWKYPDHFVSPNDDFTMHIPLWNQVFETLGIKNKENIKGLELGTAQGRATVWLLENVLTNKTSFIDTVDYNRYMWYDNDTKSLYSKENAPKDVNELILIDVVNNLEPYIKENRCEFHQCSTQDFFFNNRCKNKTYDFIYIDANHHKEWALFDGVNSFQLLNQNGIIIFDDYGWHNCKYGVEAFLSCFDEKINVIYKDWQVIIQKI
jgi:predicted O-methyltransferase YrrM